jgi:hypothetical protein
METFHSMFWLIAVLVIGIIGIIIYRFYYFPPLSLTAKKQQLKYIQAFQEEKTLVYQMAVEERTALLNRLKRTFFNAGFGSYYGQNVMVHLKSEDTHVSIQIFSDNPHNLTRNVWRVLKLKDEVGGLQNAAPDG